MSKEKPNEKLQKSSFERLGRSMKTWGVVLVGLAALVGGGSTLALKGESAWHDIRPSPTATTMSSPSSPFTETPISSSSPLSSAASLDVPSAGPSTSLVAGQSEPAGCSQAIATIKIYEAAVTAAYDANNYPAYANAYQGMSAALASDESLASNTNVRVAIYELSAYANNIAYEVRNDELTAATEAAAQFSTEYDLLGSACD